MQEFGLPYSGAELRAATEQVRTSLLSFRFLEERREKESPPRRLRSDFTFLIPK